MFTHVKRIKGEEKLHISHLFRYVSAYEYSREMLNDLITDIENAIKHSKE